MFSERKKRTRGAARYFSTSALVMSAALAGGSAAAQPPPEQAPAVRPAPLVRFDIPAGALDTALAMFEATTGLELDVRLPADALTLLQSPGVAGLHTWTDALHELLAGTGLAYRQSAARGYVVEVTGVAEAIQVTGRPGVSSPTLTEPLRDIPQTITVISRAVMDQQGVTTLRDVLRNVAGITFQAGEGGVPAGDQLTIRGFSARTDMFVDGVRDFGGYSRDSFNLEQVEVAKGPSSSIAGRGSTGGAINLVSKTPTLTPTMDGTFGVGEAGYVRATVDVNQPIAAVAIPGTAVRLNAMWNETGVPGRDVVRASRWGIAPALTLGASTHTRASFGYFKLAQDNVPEYGLPWVPANTNPDLQAYANGQPPVKSSNFYGLTGRDYETTDTDLATIDVAHDVGSATTLRTLARWGRNLRDSVITAPRFASVNTSTAINRQLQSRDMKDLILASQTSIVSRFVTGGMRHAVAAGVEVSTESSTNYARSGPSAPLADLYAPVPDDPYSGPIVRTGARTRGAADSVAAYAFDTLHLGDTLELSGGGRWEHFAVNYDSRAAAGDVTAFARSDEMISGRAGVVFKPRPEGSVYLGFGTSFNPSAEGLALTATNASLEPEKTRNLEAGAKWDLLRQQLSVTAALFRTDKTNARTPGVGPGDPPTVLAGRQRVSGLEVGVSGRLRRWWTLIANAALMGSAIARSNTPAEVDQNLALTPELSASLWTTVDIPRGLGFGLGAQYMDGVFRNASNTASVPSYWLVTGTVTYAVNSHLTLRLNGTNLANATYVDRVGGGHYIPGPGRQLLLTTVLTR